MEQIMVDVNQVSMEFNMATEKVDSIKEYVTRLVKGNLHFKSFFALQDVTLQIHKGEIFGIVGLNGSGKSTLLKIISGIMKPTTGSVELYGTISPMIELGSGFDPELTGRENVFRNGTLLGYSRKFMNGVFDENVEFSELREFLDVPLKNYSSGMQARLGFAIATVVKPQILIVDEVLSVGDFRFQEKCEQRMQELLADDTTVILVSHAIAQVEKLCQRVMWLDRGQVMLIGETSEVCERYKNSI